MKIGLFFGSFNPIHKGHLAVADYLVAHKELDEVWFVVSPQNPFKDSSSLLDDGERLELVKLAIEGHLHLKVSDVEFHLPKPSYTINTIKYLKEKYADEFILIMGEDNLSTFEQWKDYEDILKQCMVYVYPRVNIEKTSFHFHPKIKMIKGAPVIDISASMIRYAIRHHRDVKEFLPEAVWKKIEEKRLYNE